ncbi:MAG: EAL domain-containing protein [Actinomycetota bacterium]|nr:EAL domain-containing protein [Actinomycetota bacterium]
MSGIGRSYLHKSYFLKLLLLGFGYGISAKVGLLFAAFHLNVSPVWPGAGVALAALFLGGKKLWPGIVLGSLAADLTSGISVLPALGNATANSVEALAGAILLARFWQFSPTMKRMRDALSLAVVSALTPLLGALIGIGALVATGTIPVSQAWYSYRLFWFGDALGCLLFAPLIFAVTKSFDWTWRNFLHVAIAIALMAAVTFVLLVHFPSYFPFAFILLAGIVITLKLRQVGAAATSVTVCGVSIWVVLHGAGNPSSLSLASAAITLQVATAVVAAALILVATLLYERDHERTFLRVVLENLGDGIVACDAKGILTLFNRASRELHNLPATPISSGEWAEHYDLRRVDGVTPLPTEEIPLYRAFRGEDVHNAEIVIAPKNDSPRALVVSGRSIHDGDGALLGAVVAMHDVTERRKAEAALSHQTMHDPLTALPNRLLLHDRIEHALAGRGRQQAPMALLVLNLDDFKSVNDSVGREAGDRVLVTFADRLEASLRPGDTIARLDGDEFAVLLENTTQDQAVAIATQILGIVRTPAPAHDQSISADASIGIVVSETEGSSKDLLHNADLAMHAAKTSGKGKIQLFESSMHEALVERLTLEAELREAIARHQFTLHYQPIVSLITGHLKGFEALLRWNHPQRGNVSPMTIVPLAESTGLIVPLGEWILRTASLQARRWEDSHPQAQGLTMHVNISVIQLASPSITDVIHGALTDAGLSAEQLVLEVTESVVMNRGDALDVLDGLHAKGIRLAIDDFGTGYSSLSRLHSLPIDKVKIDKSFVDATANGESAPMVSATIAMAHSLGLETVAEGVESAEQLPFLQLHGCDEVQGYLFGRPVGAATIDELLRDRGAGRLWTDFHPSPVKRPRTARRE